MSRRLGSSREERRRRSGGGVAQRPWRRLRNPFRPIELLSADQVEAIHRASLRLLAELGLEFQNPEALSILAAHGARVDHATGLVRFDPDLVEASVAKAPRSFTLVPRNPERAVTLGGDHIAFAAVSGPPNVSDLERGRRPGTWRDQCDLIRLEQSLQALHLGAGVPVEAIDLPAETRHLDGCHAFLTLTDRGFNARAIGRARIRAAVEMTAIARGVPVEQMRREPGIRPVVNVNSPRRVDREVAAGLMEMARSGQAALGTPFTLAGAMRPVTLAGALTPQHPEALGVLALHQMVAPVAPVLFGGFAPYFHLN